MATASELFERRKGRNRYRIRSVSTGRPRLSVFRSNKHIYAQVIDDAAGRTLASASSREAALSSTEPVDSGDEGAPEGAAAGMARRVGKLVAERALAAGIAAVVFDRGGYRYHGRVKALADAARAAGLTF